MKAFGTTVVALVLLVSLMAAMAGCSLPSFMGGSGSMQRTAVCFMKAMQSGEITKLLPYMRPEMQILVKAIREIHEKYGDDYLTITLMRWPASAIPTSPGSWVKRSGSCGGVPLRSAT